MQREERCFGFNILFMILCWNLMSRASNVASIRLSDLDWSGDALTILFCVMKTDKAGERKFACHVYANPFQPECSASASIF